MFSDSTMSCPTQGMALIRLVIQKLLYKPYIIITGGCIYNIVKHNYMKNIFISVLRLRKVST